MLEFVANLKVFTTKNLCCYINSITQQWSRAAYIAVQNMIIQAESQI